MTATIRDSNVFSDTFKVLFAKLNTISNPGSSTKWIYSTFPDERISDKKAYPIIVIAPIDVNNTPLTFNTIKGGSMAVVIDIYSTSASQIDSLADSVADTFETYEGDLIASGIGIMKLTGTSSAFFPRDDLRIHNKTLNYEFDRVWT
jgi:hypothetical protein